MKLLIVPILALMFVACNSGEDESEVPFGKPPYNISLDQQIAYFNQNRVSYDMFRRQIANAPDEDFVISPLATRFAMSMLANGVDNADFSNSMTFSPDLAETNLTNKSLITGIPSKDKVVKVIFDNSLWFNGDDMIFDSFADIIKDSYNGSIVCDDITVGNIKNRLIKAGVASSGLIIPEVNGEMVTVCAVALNGKFTADNDIVLHEEPELYAFTCEIGSHRGFETYNMNISFVLPKDGYSVSDCIDKIISKGYRIGNLANSQTEIGNYQIPEYTIESATDLLPLYAQFGNSLEIIKIPIPGVVQGRTMTVSHILQCATLKVDQLQIGNNEPSMIVKAPFFFIVTEPYSDAVIMLGYINK